MKDAHDLAAGELNAGDVDAARRVAALVVGELRAWAARDRDGWQVAAARSGRPVAAPWYGPRGRESADRGRLRSAETHRARARETREEEPCDD